MFESPHWPAFRVGTDTPSWGGTQWGSPAPPQPAWASGRPSAGHFLPQRENLCKSLFLVPSVVTKSRVVRTL